MIKFGSVFSERLKELREERNLSQAQLALNLHNKVSQPALAMYENGQRTPSLKITILLANYFNVSLGYLAGVEEY